MTFSLSASASIATNAEGDPAAHNSAMRFSAFSEEAEALDTQAHIVQSPMSSDTAGMLGERPLPYQPRP
jgi:hypothetical protein